MSAIELFRLSASAGFLRRAMPVALWFPGDRSPRATCGPAVRSTTFNVCTWESVFGDINSVDNAMKWHSTRTKTFLTCQGLTLFPSARWAQR